MNNFDEYRQLVDEAKKQWGLLWRDRIDDKVRAEGISDKDYSLLFVDRGDVIIATRDFKPLNLREILLRHKPPEIVDMMIPPNPSIGGWGKFIRNTLRKQKHLAKRRRQSPSKPDQKEKQQRKKGGRGWLHYRFG